MENLEKNAQLSYNVLKIKYRESCYELITMIIYK